MRDMIRCFACVGGSVLALIAIAAPVGAQHVIAWIDGLRPLVRVGDRTISNFDVVVYIAVQRMVAGRPLLPPPTEEEHTLAAVQLLQQLAILEEAQRGGHPPPSPAIIEAARERIVAAYGDGDPELLESRTGISLGRLQAELQRRLQVQSYLENVLLANLRIAEADVRSYYAASSTAFADLPYAVAAPQVRRLLETRALRDELRDLRDRFMARESITLYDPKLTEALKAQHKNEDSLEPILSPPAP